MYRYRQLNPSEREELLAYRKSVDLPLHAPPHLLQEGDWYLITAATYEHVPYFTTEQERLQLLKDLLGTLHTANLFCNAWVLLPTHYHLLTHCATSTALGTLLGQVHGRTSRAINLRDQAHGRRVWYKFTDRHIRSQRHYYTTLNYIHYNPVKHGYVNDIADWKCSSFPWYLDRFGEEWLADIWHKYPVLNYGQGWDWTSS
ncbi:MAG: REP-associated tyrosine transposase [Armatimonadota bacterium]